MQQEDSQATVPHDTEETEEPVLVEAQEFSEDDETFGQVEEDNHSDFDYYEEVEDQEEEDDFEEEDDEMSLTRIGLHDLNTLRHLYRFSLMNTAGRKILLLITHSLFSPTVRKISTLQ